MKRGYLDRPGCRVYLRSRRRGPDAGVRARARRQSPELVAAGAAFPRPLHLRDLRASRLCAVERAAGRPGPGRIRGRSRGAGRSSRRRRRAHRGAIDGRLDRARIRAGKPFARARAGARLDRRHDRARASHCSPIQTSCPRGSAMPLRLLPPTRRTTFTSRRGERMAREQPAAHFLYQEIDALSGIDKAALRAKPDGRPDAARRGAAHAERPDAVAHRRRRHRLSAVSLRYPGEDDAERARRADPARRPLGLFRAAGRVQPARGRVSRRKSANAPRCAASRSA